MFGQFHYHSALRKYIIMFGNMFNDIDVVRFNKAGESTQQIRVPIAYGPKEKFLRRLNEPSSISDGTKVEISSSKFFLGSSTNFISGSDGNIKVSGSKIELEAPTFLLGRKRTQFVSGSNGQIEISLEGYYKTMDNLITYKAGYSNLSSTEPWQNSVEYNDLAMET